MKKGILLAVCLMLVGMLSIGGTYAYGESQSVVERIWHFVADVFGGPETDLTKVNIENKFLIRASNSNGDIILTEGTQEQLVPGNVPKNFDWDNPKITFKPANSTYSYKLWSDEDVPGAVDKFVSVKNLGSEPVYFRTAIAIQYNEQLWPQLHLNRNLDKNLYAWSNYGGKQISINGKDYVLLVASYKNALQPGETSEAMIMQVALGADVTNAMIEEGFDIRVLTVAIEQDAFVENGVTLDALPALEKAAPLDKFNPFN